MKNIIDQLLIQWKKIIIIFVFGLIIFLLIPLIRGLNQLIYYVDGSFVAGILLLSCGLFSILNNMGAFDFIQYSSQTLMHQIKKEEGRKYKDYPDYVDKKKEERRKRRYLSVPYFLVSIIFIIISIILYICM